MTQEHPNGEYLEKIRQRQEEVLRRVEEGAIDGAIVAEILQRVVEGRPVDFQLEDRRTTQAWRLYDAGWGRELGQPSFQDYLATIPLVPDWPADWHEQFDRVILVDARLPLTKMCELLHVDILGDDETFVDFHPEHALQGVYWMRCQDGRKYHNVSIRQCWKKFGPNEVGLTAAEGLCLFLQERGVLEDHFPVLPGSVLRRRGFSAFLRPLESGPSLDWIWSGHADAKFGAASRGSLSRSGDAGASDNKLNRLREALVRLWRNWLVRR